MKAILPVLILALAAILPARGSEDLERLRTSWKEARERALEPVDRKYLTALKALKDRLTKAGDLDGALAVENEITAVELGESAGGQSAQPKELQALVGVWQRDSDNRFFNIPDTTGGTFNGNQKFTMTWDPEKKRVVVVSDQWVNYFWASNDPDTVNGGYEQDGRMIRYKIKRVK